MLDLSLFKVPGAILAHARSLILGEEATAPLGRAAKTGQESILDVPERSFRASVAAADRRLTDLRRAIAEAEPAQSQAAVDATSSIDSRLGESRCEAAQRVIAEALGAEKP